MVRIYAVIFTGILLLFNNSAFGGGMTSMKTAIQQIGAHANMLPIEKGITLPMVSIENDIVIVRRLIYFTRLVPKEGTYITPPQFVAVFDLTNNKFITLKKFEDLGLSGFDKSPWVHNRPVFKDANDIIPEFERIWSLYDHFISYYIKNQPVDIKSKKEALEFMQLFRKHAEKPLAPYYRHYSGNFLDWVKEVSEGNNE